jgi:hypothetical protein
LAEQEASGLRSLLFADELSPQIANAIAQLALPDTNLTPKLVAEVRQALDQMVDRRLSLEIGAVWAAE